MADFTPVDPSSTLLAISKMALPPPEITAVSRMLSRAPVAIGNWEAAVSIVHSLIGQYMTYNPNLQPITDADAEEIGWIYAPVVMWPAKERQFIIDCLTVCTLIDDYELPEGYDNLKKAIIFYNGESGVSTRLLSMEHANDGTIPKISVGASVLTGASEDNEEHNSYQTYDSWTDVIYRFNLVMRGVIFNYSYLASQLGELFSYPLVPLYCILQFLRETLPSSVRPGTFVDSDQWTLLETIATPLMSNT
jgi:hypothetical protein